MIDLKEAYEEAKELRRSHRYPTGPKSHLTITLTNKQWKTILEAVEPSKPADTGAP